VRHFFVLPTHILISHFIQQYFLRRSKQETRRPTIFFNHFDFVTKNFDVERFRFFCSMTVGREEKKSFYETVFSWTRVQPRRLRGMETVQDENWTSAPNQLGHFLGAAEPA
jgi:hypothetical protein